jgi:hypothetical protein
VAVDKTIHPGKICLGLFLEVMSLMSKAKKTGKNNMNPDPSVLEGIPAKNPHADAAKKDANFKKSRAAQR